MTFHDRRSRGQRGAVAVEFAIIMVPLFLMLIGAIEFGRVYSQLQVYQGAAREGARCAAVQAASPPGSVCNILTQIQTHLAGYPAPSSVTVSVSPPPNGSPYACSGRQGARVTVSWPQTFGLNIPFWNSASITRTIVGSFRCE
jgi:Flp pilus assembly protein TadG